MYNVIVIFILFDYISILNKRDFFIFKVLNEDCTLLRYVASSILNMTAALSIETLNRILELYTFQSKLIVTAPCHTSWKHFHSIDT